MISIKMLKSSQSRKRKLPQTPTQRSQRIITSSFALDYSEKRKKTIEPKIIDLTEALEPNQESPSCKETHIGIQGDF